MCALLVAAFAVSCQPVTPRPPGTDGSARWAYGIAQPLLQSFAADAELREVLGSGIAPDGRLGADAGAWTMVAYSPSRAETLSVTVDARGSAASTTRAVAAPGPGVARPIPAGWVDSITVMEVLRARLGVLPRVTLIAFNVADYGGALRGQAVWGVAFERGPNQLVSWDGKDAGAQGASSPALASE